MKKRSNKAAPSGSSPLASSPLPRVLYIDPEGPDVERDEKTEPVWFAVETEDHWAQIPYVPKSSYDALMGQIEAMRDRARQYAEESEAERNYEEGHRHRSVEGTLNELHRLGKFFQENT